MSTPSTIEYLPSPICNASSASSFPIHPFPAKEPYPDGLGSHISLLLAYTVYLNVIQLPKVLTQFALKAEGETNSCE